MSKLNGQTFLEICRTHGQQTHKKNVRILGQHKNAIKTILRFQLAPASMMPLQNKNTNKDEGREQDTLKTAN